MADGVLLPREFTARETIIAPETKTEMDSLPVAKESGIANQVKFM
jgi:cobyric acid synthase